ncbi:helix-turn-helix domain-containing protein [Methylobacterium oxalidis]|uniref:helix-turn-helix domain-containing protein n=1 Tax=Methylobacterium oxalidis TaxID=944322 RepID=UPI0033161482
MRSGTVDVMPASVRRSLRKLGGDIALARRKRRLTAEMMMERTGLSKATYARVEAGEPTVSVGAYAMALFALGLGPALGQLADPRKDDTGLLMEEERLPKRVRRKAEVRP